MDAQVKEALPFTNKPLVMYGTSILHGCSASRAGMSFPSMLGRRFDAPVINMGFSGNGLTEEYFGRIMGEIDASVYFIDCLPNMSAFTPDEVKLRTLALVRNLRKQRPSTPIVLVEDRTHTNFRSKPIININRTGLKAAHEILRDETGNIYYIKGDDLLGKNSDSTVDGSHPSDLGMYYYYKKIEPVLKKIIHPTRSLRHKR
jgi:lysophospholipase L1-like esterase